MPPLRQPGKTWQAPLGKVPVAAAKTIAERSGVRMPSFFGYIFVYSVPILLPVLLVVAWKYCG